MNTSQTPRHPGCHTHRLLTNANVALAIRREQTKLAQTVEITREAVVAGLESEARSQENNGAPLVQAWSVIARWKVRRER